MSEQGKIGNALEAEAVVRRRFEAVHGDRIEDLSISRVWYSSAGTKEVWEVQGTLRLKKDRGKEKSIRYLVDPVGGEIFGYEEIWRRR